MGVVPVIAKEIVMSPLRQQMQHDMVLRGLADRTREAYIAAVARRLDVKANDVIDVRKPATLGVMVVSIIAHENAGFAYPEAVLAEGLRRALA